jgi:hypothetical protein
MPAWRERGGRAAVVAALVVAGFALTLWVFYPGVLNYDSRYVYSYITPRHYGDWQSPVLTLLWAWIDPIAPGSASLFLLIATVYWLAFLALALAIARRSLWLAIALPILAVTPPAFVLVGMVWRDVLFVAIWLAAAALVFATTDCGRKWQRPAQVLALALLCLGVLLRPNALVAAPILAAFLLWPTRFFWKRTALLYVPAALALFALVQVVYYGVLGAARENPLHSILVFDLGGISHFSKQNQFPVTWTPEQEAQITDRCYEPIEWDEYWTHDCTFVMERLERDKIFGTPKLVAAWWQAVSHHPVAYAQHRLAFMWNFLAGQNRVMWTRDLDAPDRTVMADNRAFMALKAVHDTLLPTPVFRAGVWLLLCVVVCGLGWRQRDHVAGAFALGVGGSAVAYVMSFLVFGVASDYRYAYWAVLAGLVGIAVVLAPVRPQDAAAP